MKVEELITNICIEGTIPGVIAELERLQNVYKDKYTNMYLCTCISYVDYDDSPYAEVCLYGAREETAKMEGIVHGLRNVNDLDEAPGAYKDIADIMKLQEDLVEPIVKLRPLAVVKG